MFTISRTQQKSKWSLPYQLLMSMKLNDGNLPNVVQDMDPGSELISQALSDYSSLQENKSKRDHFLPSTSLDIHWYVSVQPLLHTCHKWVLYNVLVHGLLSHNYCKLGNLRTAEIHCSQSEGWKSKIRVPAWWGPSSGLQMADFSSYPQVAKGARELPQASFISGLIPFITSQRSRLPIPSPRGFNKWIWQRHKRSVYSNK